MGGYVMAGDFVHEDTTNFGPPPTGVYRRPGILLAGLIGCLERKVIDVRKILEVVGGVPADPLVETRVYRYNVSIQGVGRSKGNIFRYDNGHPDTLYPGHADPHHKHAFDWQTGEELPGSPVWVGAHGWPHLNDVIEEARHWYHYNRSTLPDPEAFPQLRGRHQP